MDRQTLRDWVHRFNGEGLNGLFDCAHGAGAGWHQRGRRLKVPENISLLSLPPYSPELNPVENVWRYLKQNFLSNRVFDTHDNIVDAWCSAWNTLMAAPDRIRSIAQREWAKTVRS
jgi:transposase